MKYNRKGTTLIGLIIVMVIIVPTLTFISQMVWYDAFIPIIKNIIPLVIGMGVGYWMKD